MPDETTIVARWVGENFLLGRNHVATINRIVEDGGDVVLSLSTPRHMAEHRAYFAQIAEYYANIPEQLEEMPFAASTEHFRKHALIATGYADVQSIDCGHKTTAERVAARLRGVGDYSVVKVSGPVILHSVARSQSVRAMPNGEFKKSKKDVLEWMASICGAEITA